MEVRICFYQLKGLVLRTRLLVKNQALTSILGVGFRQGPNKDSLVLPYDNFNLSRLMIGSKHGCYCSSVTLHGLCQQEKTKLDVIFIRHR